MRKLLKCEISKRCEDMNKNFKNNNINCEDFIIFGDCIKKARNELLKAEQIAYKMFKHKNDEYKIVEELLTLIEEYRNQMDNNPVEIILKGWDTGIMNSVFYGPTMEDNIHLESFFKELDRDNKQLD